MSTGTTSTRGIARQSRLQLWLDDSAFSPAPFLARRRGGLIIEPLRPFPHDASPDEALERTQRSVVFRGDEADRIADRVRAAGAPDPMDVILGVHRKIVIHDV
jgi:hypothetical protein